MMNKIKLTILASMFAVSSALADGIWVAILETTGDKTIDIASKKHVTDKIRAEALKILNDEKKYKIIDKDTFKKRLPSNVSLEDCTEQCAVDIGQKISANVITQSIISKIENKYSLSIHVYDVSNGTLVGSNTFDAANVSDFDSIIQKNSNSLFEKVIKRPWSGVEYKVDNSSAEFLKQKIIKKKIVKITSTPAGAKLTIDGTVAQSCPTTPCNIVIEEGSHDFKFTLQRYAQLQKKIEVKDQNQAVDVKLVPTFGILKVNPKFAANVGEKNDLLVSLDGQRKNKYDSLIIEDNDKHIIALTHPCYENVEVTIGFDHGGQEHVIDSMLTVSKSILDLNVVDSNGNPIEVDVYIHGRKEGKSPFTEYVPTCSKVSVGPFKESVKTNLRKNARESINYTYRGTSTYKDSRNNTNYDLVQIGNDIWFKQNLSYSDLADRNERNYDSYNYKYNYYYSYDNAQKACPEDYHMATRSDWENLLRTNGGIEKLSLPRAGAMRPNYYETIDKKSADYFWLNDSSAVYFKGDSPEAKYTKTYYLPVRCVKDN